MSPRDTEKFLFTIVDSDNSINIALGSFRVGWLGFFQLKRRIMCELHVLFDI